MVTGIYGNQFSNKIGESIWLLVQQRNEHDTFLTVIMRLGMITVTVFQKRKKLKKLCSVKNHVLHFKIFDTKYVP
jgi:hypothetical protein